jgi:AcrR family transcriptional regulator
MERGFDRVTVDEIAAAADVGRMTVFNHFPRKEDMFFDLDEQGREVLRGALRRRDPYCAPIETLRSLAHQLLAQVVTVALSEGAGRELTDPDARLAAALLLATWTLAFIQAHQTFRQTQDTEEANAAFLAIVDKGTIGLKAAMAGTPYA